MWRSDGKVRHVNLKTPFRARARFGARERHLLRVFRRRLASRGITCGEVPTLDGGVILSCVLTVADAFAVRYHGLTFSLLEAFPELRDEEEALHLRIAALEDQFHHRKAS